MPLVRVASWWALILRGIAAIIFGILTFLWPGISLSVLALFFGAYVLIDGILAIIAAIRAMGHHRRWGAFLLEGIAGILIGLFALFIPFAAVTLFVYIVAAWALVTGALEISAAIRLRQHVPNEWVLVLTGILSLLFGILLFIWPIAGVVALAWLIAVYAVIFGILWLTLGFRLRNHPIYLITPPSAIL